MRLNQHFDFWISMAHNSKVTDSNPAPPPLIHD
ncbi:uncharacterized protein METZ01_LOCUS507939 [marine metagenome]|uniref:Uncharacterized protein n=1 Tax=marine metagenome TaxID=408172 RepID=A0A383EFI3_9ZZZZ